MKCKLPLPKRFMQSDALKYINKVRSSRPAVVFVSTLAIFTDSLTCGIIVPAMPDLLQNKLGMSISANGILFGCFGLGIIIGAIVSSIISDRLNIRKMPMIIGLIGLGATSALFAVSTAFWQLILARIAQGISSGVSWAIGLSMIADAYPGEQIGTPMGFSFMGYTIGYMGGPIFGGFLYDFGGMHAIAVFIAAFVVIDLIFRLLLIEPKEIIERERLHRILHEAEQDSASILPGGNGSRTSVDSDKDANRASADDVGSSRIVTARPSISNEDAISVKSSTRNTDNEGKSAKDAQTDSKEKDGDGSEAADDIGGANSYLTIWKLLKEMPIVVCCLGAMFHAGCAGALEPVLPVELAQKYGMNSGRIGGMMVAFSVPGALFSPIFGWLSDNPKFLRMLAPFGRLGMIGLFTVLTAIVLALLATANNIASIVVVLVFIGIFTDGAVVPVIAAMGNHVHYKGWNCYAQLYALFNIAYSVAILITPTIGSVVLNAIGFKWTCGFLGLLLMGGFFLIMGPPWYKYIIKKELPPPIPERGPKKQDGATDAENNC
ncbi:hypothetical protein H4219_000638 [Mycoemilia scoparia]|uniref:Major facilitator superfamily (MFS) profile domain-containing protein n=1 Tax=Mycoemilia scoparia TaxID=417184 RepID=A0A9W8A8G4_9FUNG|nr:hypothetical protein H4219_000638 [Mycoemilia scoparia]